MSDKVKIKLIVVLAVLALVLGFVAYRKSGETSNKTNDTKISGKIDFDQFSEDEMKLLHPPEPGADKTEVDEHSKLAEKLAVVGTEVEIMNCKSTPLVLQASIKSSVMVKNSGDKDISISFDGKKNINVASGKSADVKSSLVNGFGLYGYLCEYEGFKGLVGFVLATP